MEDLVIVKKEFANKRAAEYRSRGYEVWQDAPLDFMPGFRADLLVRKNGETRVIAVQTRTGAISHAGAQGTGGGYQSHAPAGALTCCW